MDNDSDGDIMMIGPLAATMAASNDGEGRQRPQRQHQSGRRTRRRQAAAATMLTVGLATVALAHPSHAIMEEDNMTSSRNLEIGGTKTRAIVVPAGSSSPEGRASNACNPETQHTLLFTLFTDAHSIHDNYWKFSHAPFGVGLEAGNSASHINSESVGTGNLGYSAVITHTVCADKADPSGNTVGNPDTNNGAPGAATHIESCYDFELMDSNGDGLTAAHGAAGPNGLAGGFMLQIDYGTVVVEHRGLACVSDDEDEWNDCAVENGFDYCGVRVCTVIEEEGGGELGKATISNLAGSHCSLHQPTCDASNDISTSSSSIKVLANTDSYADELSYEVRRSSRNDSTRMNSATQGELILAGGNPVYAEGTETVILGQLGVGVAMADNESYETSMCLPDTASTPAAAEDSCFDFRAYDAYGDGMGCGADGTLSIVLETPDERWKLEQVDDDQAKRQNVNGSMKLACMNKKKLSKWSYCAVRVCADGTVEGLQGNQCDFGMGDELIDEDYLDMEIDPLQEGGVPVPPQENVVQAQSGNKPQKPENEKVEMETFDSFELNIVDYKPKPGNSNQGSNNANSNNNNNGNGSTPFNANNDPSWAEYYEALQPGFEEDGAFQQPTPNSVVSYQDLRPNKQGQKGPRPNAAKLNNDIQQVSSSAGSKPKPAKQGVATKGPRPNSNKLNSGQDDMMPNSAQQQDDNGHNDQIVLPLKPFGTNLLDVNFPKSIKYPGPNAKFPRPNQLSAAVATFLLETFAENDGVDTPLDFMLWCEMGRKSVGPEEVHHVECDGHAIYAHSAEPPRMKILNSLVRDAFEGEMKEEFLELMYGEDAAPLVPSSSTNTNTGGGGSNSNASKKRKKKQQKRKKMLQRLKAKQAMMEAQKEEMQQQSSPAPGTSVNINTINQGANNPNNDKKQAKLDKKQAKQEAKQAQSSPAKGGGLNVMGYVSGSQNMNQLSSSLGPDGNIIVYIDGKKDRRRDPKNGKGGDDDDRRHRMLRSRASSVIGR